MQVSPLEDGYRFTIVQMDMGFELSHDLLEGGYCFTLKMNQLTLKTLYFVWSCEFVSRRWVRVKTIFHFPQKLNADVHSCAQFLLAEPNVGFVYLTIV